MVRTIAASGGFDRRPVSRAISDRACRAPGQPLSTPTAETRRNHTMFDPKATLDKVDPEVFAAIVRENQRQEDHIELIASENYTSPAVMAAQGSQLTNKYAEGYPGKRYYGGCEFVDQVETLAIERARALFGAEAANVQPNSGSQANQAILMAFLKPGDRIMGMSLAEGGHLTHGMPLNMSGKWFDVVSYGLDANERIDYDAMAKLAREARPKLIIAGASAYSLRIDWERFAEVAREIGAIFMVDMAHYAGLIAAGEYPNPVPHADVVTSTTHKSLRGPRGGFILMKAEHEKAINSAVFPGLQGRAADARDRRQGSRLRRGPQAGVQGGPAAGGAQCQGARRGADRAGPAHRLGRHRVARDARGPAAEEHHREGGRGRAGARPHHRQQERDPQRSREALRDQRHPARLARDDDARLRRGRGPPGRPPDRRRARGAGRRIAHRAGPRAGRGPHSPLPGLRPELNLRPGGEGNALSLLRASRYAGRRNP